MTTHVDATRKKLADRGSIPLISTIQTLEKEDKKLLSLWLSSFLFYQLTSYVESRYRKEKSKKLISK